jgi:competence protein ComGA
MDVGEKRKAQLGAITYLLPENKQRLRLSSVGDYRGQESMVIRFLHTRHQQIGYFYPEDLSVIQEYVQQKVGLYLFSGPTGSGKTTMMYELARQSTGQVITIEDPVEIEEVTFLQLQTNEKIGQTYDQLIKLALRHRPDLLIIGEIRDRVTALAAIRAALTGHTVLATVHAKGLHETKSRLIDLVGTDTELKHCLNGVLYQQLFLNSTNEVQALVGYEFFFDKQLKESFPTRYKQLQQQGEICEKRKFS